MICMDADCHAFSHWRSEDGYPFCNMHGYAIYSKECELEMCLPHPFTAWMLHGRPHGPLGGGQKDQCEHRLVTEYTILDWRETGIPPGFQCEDCGEDVEEPEDTRSFYRDDETGKVAW